LLTCHLTVKFPCLINAEIFTPPPRPFVVLLFLLQLLRRQRMELMALKSLRKSLDNYLK